MSTATEYRELLVRFLPHPIRSAADYRRSLVQLERLMVPRPTAARSQFIEVLATLIERYESRDYPLPECDSADVLRNLLDAKRVSPAVVAKATGIPPATVSNAVMLGKYFGVSATVFLDAAEAPRARGRGPVRNRPRARKRDQEPFS
jgi:antitoxin component HigA of HigAB toxin-antitoxin module